MNIVRQIRRKSPWCLVFAENYTSNLDHLDLIFEMAKAYYPDLKRSEVNVQTLGGERYSRMVALSFRPTEDGVKEGWYEVDYLEPFAG